MISPTAVLLRIKRRSPPQNQDLGCPQRITSVPQRSGSKVLTSREKTSPLARGTPKAKTRNPEPARPPRPREQRGIRPHPKAQICPRALARGARNYAARHGAGPTPPGIARRSPLRELGPSPAPPQGRRGHPIHVPSSLGDDARRGPSPRLPPRPARGPAPHSPKARCPSSWCRDREGAPLPPSPAIAKPLRTLRMRKVRRPSFPPARASSSPGSPPLVSPRGAKWPKEAAATAAARPPRTGAEGRGGAGRKAGRGGAGLTVRVYRPAPRLPLAGLPGGPEGREPLSTSPSRRFSAASVPYAVGTRVHCLQTGRLGITTLHRGLPSTYRSQHSFEFQNFCPAATDAHFRGSRSGFSHHPATAEAQGARQRAWKWGLEP